MPLHAAWDPYTAKDIQQLERVQRRAARFVKKNYRHTTSVTGLLDELGWLPLFERCNTLNQSINQSGEFL